MNWLPVVFYSITIICLLALMVYLVYLIRFKSIKPPSPRLKTASQAEALKSLPGSPATSKGLFRYSTSSNIPSSQLNPSPAFPLVYDKLDPAKPSETNLEADTLGALENVQKQLLEIQAALARHENNRLDNALTPENRDPQKQTNQSQLLNQQLNDLSQSYSNNESEGIMQRLARQFQHLEQYIKARLFR